MVRKIIYTLVFVLAGMAFCMAQNIPSPMSPPRLVNDFTGFFSDRENRQLERKLENFADTTSTQIAVVAVADLDGDDISSYAAKLFDKWGIGSGREKNNGILILIKPKTADSAGQVFISTGYGLEGVVPDIVAGRIVDGIILPEFRAGNNYAAIDKATTTLMGLVSGEFTADQVGGESDSLRGLIGFAVLFVLVVLIIVVVAAVGGHNRGGGSDGGSGGGGYTMSSRGGDVAAGMLLGALLGGRGGGYSGGGGGGFGGFGGGLTGGGGAGGSW